MRNDYDELAELAVPAMSWLTVAEAEAGERRGIPWPICGDRRLLKAQHNPEPDTRVSPEQ